MNPDPGHLPAMEELALQLAAEHVVIEMNVRLDRNDVEGALDLYTDDAVLGKVKGRDAIRDAIRHAAAARVRKHACHTVTNVRSVVDDESLVTIDCTVVTYLLDGPRPYGANAIVNMCYLLRVAPDGNLRVVEQRVGRDPLSCN